MARGLKPARTRLPGRRAFSTHVGLCLALFGMALAASVMPALARDIVLPVPRVTIYPGNVITEEMLVDKAFRGNASSVQGIATTREMLVGKVARGTLLPNAPVPAGGVREAHAVQQGQPAVVIFQAGGLLISATAVSLQAGSAGDVISLRNTDSGTTIRGVVQADGTVRVGP
ncbi:flagellar basal body P-ring formation chaperone FlgA [Hyphomicrobium sp. CS1GBMeth3]|uniref:flagellar basal body P-ring formation chaperone FlgA n=1 Tax=Hyphomicrobium sp. CS1GBMeth3 TaxID=1892845 RepID=UPI0009FA5B42|nr:flagellar basal body P-ring formation chaperone FlgA [Hyphomicrobium sp. CS1GBMeth3]